VIFYVEGNLFESPASVLVNTVNTVGVMGKGVAAAFRRLYPEMFGEYRALCEAGKIAIGTLWLYRTANKSVLNFPTKTHWRKPSKPEYVEEGLRTFVRVYQAAGISSVAFPALGCGNGGLDFQGQVKPLMERYLRDVKANVFVYPHRVSTAAPEHREIGQMSRWLRSVPEDLSFVEVWDELASLVASGPTFPCDDRTVRFHYQLSTEPQGIRVSWSDGEYTLLYEQLLDIWQELRAVGFSECRVSGTSSSLLARAVQALLTQLPYVRSVRLAPSYDSESAFRDGARYGVQFTPRTASHAPQLDFLSVG
jgi:O-acetyl-ADP-ribose deacetylase (regulator of RNase III)